MATPRKPKEDWVKQGRPTVYKPEYAYMAEVACREGGFSDFKLSKLFSVSKASITHWRQKYPEFLASIVKGKDDHDSLKIEGALRKRSLGFTYTQTTSEREHVRIPVPDDYDGDPAAVVDGMIVTDKMIVTKKVRKTVTPDTPAIKFWLTNRQPGRWVDKKEFDVNQAPAVPDSTDDLDTNAKRDLCKHVLG